MDEIVERVENNNNKIHKTYYPMKNYDLVQDRFFIYNEVINIPLIKIVILSLNIILIVNILIFH